MQEADSRRGAAELPSEFVDAHHHFLDTCENDFQSFLGSLVPFTKYLPEDYERDVVMPLERNGVRFVGSVHVECLPDCGSKEVSWVDSLASKRKRAGSWGVRAIVASLDLTSDRLESEIDAIQASSSLVRGVRWILDNVGPFEDGKTATHVATTRHQDVGDYLRGHTNGKILPSFERGYAFLAETNSCLSFDLQCAPAQLKMAAELAERYPTLPVCIDHLGKPRTVLNADGSPNEEEIQVWRDGMRAMARLSHVYCKISMLGYVIPGWIELDKGRALMKQLVCETVQMFGPNRCMVGLNWWKNAAMSDADGLSDIGPDPVQFIKLCVWFFDDYNKKEQKRLFCDTAREFYRF